MEVNERQTGEVLEIAEAQERAKLGRAAHKIAWTRMNGSTNAANPFVDAEPDRLPTDRTNRSSSHR